MSDLTMGFNPMAVEPATGGGGQLPVSTPQGHRVHIVDAEWKDNSKKNGQHLNFKLEIVEGPGMGKVGFYSLNLGHTGSTKAVEIAQSELSSICRCIGHTTAITQPCCRDIWNRPFNVVVALQDGEDGEKGYTEITGIRDIYGRKANELDQAVQGQVAAAPAAIPAAPAAIPAAPAAIPVAPVAPVAIPAAPVQQIPVAPAPVAPVAAPAIPPQGVAAVAPLAPATATQISAAIGAAPVGADPAAQQIPVAPVAIPPAPPAAPVAPVQPTAPPAPPAAAGGPQWAAPPQ